MSVLMEYDEEESPPVEEADGDVKNPVNIKKEI